MRRLLVIGAVVVVAAAVGVAIAIAATGGGSSTDTRGATVSVQKIAGGSVLVDSKGKALYRSAQERNGMVLCTGSCLSFWHPLIVKGTPKAPSLSGKLGVVRRPDGRRQVTYNGKLLYTFELDGAGDLKGDNVQDAFGSRKFHWHVVRPVGATVPSSPKPASTPAYPSY